MMSLERLKERERELLEEMKDICEELRHYRGALRPHEQRIVNILMDQLQKVTIELDVVRKRIEQYQKRELLPPWYVHFCRFWREFEALGAAILFGENIEEYKKGKGINKTSTSH